MARNKDNDAAVAEVEELEVDETEGDETEETEVHKPITPADIADATGADPKAIRGYLRANFPRSKEMKGKSWDIPAGVADKVIEHFRTKDEDVEVDEELEVIEELSD
jgi:hypothetical protein